MSEGKWKVVIEPEGKNPGLVDKAKAAAGLGSEQVGGMVIYVTDGGNVKNEVAAVGYIRKHTANPCVSFVKQLEAEVEKAQQACDKLNELLGGNNRAEDGTRVLA
jgi:hypothetical protein